MSKKVFMKRFILSVVTLFIVTIAGIVIYDRATVNNEYSINEKDLQIPIFVYHNIVDSEADINFDYMETTKDTFEKQISGLKSLGYDFITYEDLLKYKNNEKKIKKKSCIVTFDDGCEGVYKNAYPIAKKYNIPITMYVITDNMESPGVITWDEAKEMQDSGLVTIASHSTNHPQFTDLSTDEAIQNVKDSYTVIEEHLGSQKTKIFTYPYGLCTDDEINALSEQGYVQNLTDNKINKSKNLDLSRLHRCYPLSDSTFKMIAKIMYRDIRYGG